MKNPCKVCEPSICRKCERHKHDNTVHPQSCTFFAPEALCAKHEYIKKVKDAIGEFSKLDLKPNEKIQIAQEIQSAVDFVRFMAHVDKECLKCHAKNKVNARLCVKCDSIFICDRPACSKEEWRCQHGAGFRKVEEKKIVKRPPSEPKPPKPEREKVIREVIEKRARFVLVDG